MSNEGNELAPRMYPADTVGSIVRNAIGVVTRRHPSAGHIAEAARRYMTSTSKTIRVPQALRENQVGLACVAR